MTLVELHSIMGDRIKVTLKEDGKDYRCIKSKNDKFIEFVI